MKIAIITQHDPFLFTPMLYDFIRLCPFEIKAVIRIGQRQFGYIKRKKYTHLEKIISSSLIFGAFRVIKGILISYYNRFLLRLNPQAILWGEDQLYSIIKSKKIQFICIKENRINCLKDILVNGDFDTIINHSGIIFPEEIIKIAEKKIINIHHSLLPKHRGRMPSFWSFLDSNPEYGVTIHFMNKQIDRGPIIVQEKLDIPIVSTLPEIVQFFKASVPSLICKALLLMQEKQFVPQKQIKGNNSLNSFPSINDALRYRKLLKIRRNENTHVFK